MKKCIIISSFKKFCLDKIENKMQQLNKKENLICTIVHVHCTCIPACMKNILEDNKVYKKKILIQKESSTDHFFLRISAEMNIN